MIYIFGKDLIDKLRGKSSKDETLDFDEDSSFSKHIWEAHKNAEEKFRTETPKFAKAFFTRPEERVNPHYPPVFQGPFGDPTKEGPLTKDLDERFFREHGDLERGMEGMQNSANKNGFGMEGKWGREQNFGYPEYSNSSNDYFSSSSERYNKRDEEPWKMILEELQRIREQNAVIIEKLSSIERRLM